MVMDSLKISLLVQYRYYMQVLSFRVDRYVKDGGTKMAAKTSGTEFGVHYNYFKYYYCKRSGYKQSQCRKYKVD